jgi:penicillin amidase
MSYYEPEASEAPQAAPLPHRTIDDGPPPPHRRLRRLIAKVSVILIAVILVLTIAGFFVGRHWVRQSLHDSLPQLDGTLSIASLSAPVTVQRDTHGVPHIRAASLDDLVIAQGYITTQDRLWQMDTLRRYVAGELAEVLGPSLLPHDRIQRTLQIRAAADRALANYPPDQLHWLELYARGVNASIEAQRPHLPLEFRILRYQPATWTPRDTIVVGLALYQDLTTSFPDKLNREALTAKLPPHLIADLYPVGSWRDHPPAQPQIDLTAPQTDIPDIPLDESQTKLTKPTTPGAPSIAKRWVGSTESSTVSTQDLLALEKTLNTTPCESCKAGSNNWTVSGAHTATGKPLLSNDMHLSHSVPGIWYQADLEAPAPDGTEFHVTGLSLPGVPFIIVGHNDHIAWGFTNLGADVQNVYIEHTRGTGDATEYQTSDNTWHSVLHQKEVIHVRNKPDVILDVTATQHGDTATPIISPILPSEKRSLSLRWAIYDPANVTASLFSIDTAHDWPTFCTAFSTFGGPSQNAVYADDQGHIGYHAVGHIPLRGSLVKPSPLSPVPTDALDPDQEWTSYIPFDQLPQSFDPPSGILATANSRITPDDYPFPINLDWGAPYRNERIWKVLSAKDHLTPANMLALQTDVYSDVDHVVAQRLAYAIDHATNQATIKDKRLHQAADLLRSWDGNVEADDAAPAIVAAANAAFWPLILNPQLGPNPGDSAKLYTWYEKPYAQEWLFLHTPARWLPSNYATWDDLLAAAVTKGLLDAHAPFDLSKWRYGKANPVDIEHPIYSQSDVLRRLIGLPVGTGPQPQSGDRTTVKQVDRTFGPSERFTADLSNLDNSTLNIVLGESANPASPWFLDQWPAWYKGTTFSIPFTHEATNTATTHTLTLTPK